MGRGQMQSWQSRVECVIKALQHDDAEHGDLDQPRRPRDRVVDARCDAGARATGTAFMTVVVSGATRHGHAGRPGQPARGRTS